MIEFKGSFIQDSTGQIFQVLVQFDGSELHVWHEPEPFFHLATCDAFNVSVRQRATGHYITLPNGARIETADVTANALVEGITTTIAPTQKYGKQYQWAILMILLLVTLFGLWFLAEPVISGIWGQ